MKRWHEEIVITKRNWRKHYLLHVESNLQNNRDRIGLDPYDVDRPCDKQIGRFRKQDAFDCGNPRCSICHWDKYPKREMHNQEVLSNLSFKEQLKEFKDARINNP